MRFAPSTFRYRVQKHISNPEQNSATLLHFMLGLSGHAFAKGEDAVHSAPVAINLDQLFAPTFFTLRAASELGLTAIPMRRRLTWQTQGNTSAAPPAPASLGQDQPPGSRSHHLGHNFTVTLHAMDIRTFVLEGIFRAAPED